MKQLTAALTIGLAAAASAGPVVLYVSEIADKPIAVYSLDESTVS